MKPFSHREHVEPLLSSLKQAKVTQRLGGLKLSNGARSGYIHRPYPGTRSDATWKKGSYRIFHPEGGSEIVNVIVSTSVTWPTTIIKEVNE